MKYDIRIDNYIGSWMCNADYVRSCLEGLQGKHADILVSSLGGDARQALLIYQLLRDHGDVTVHLHGFVASAATIIAMGAKTVMIGKHTLFLIHKCLQEQFVWETLNEEQISELIKDLQKQQNAQKTVDTLMANIYAERTGMESGALLKLMSEAEWHDAQWCLDNHFADSIIDDRPAVADNSIKALVAAAGLPDLPKCGKPTIGQQIKEFFGVTVKEDNREDIQEDIQPDKTIDTVNCNMKDLILALVCAAAGVDKFTVDSDGNAAVSESQLQAIEAAIKAANDKLAKAEKTITALTKERDTLTAQVKKLEDMPAEDSHTKVDDEVQADEDRARTIYAHLKNCL